MSCARIQSNSSSIKGFPSLILFSLPDRSQIGVIWYDSVTSLNNPRIAAVGANCSNRGFQLFHAVWRIALSANILYLYDDFLQVALYAL
jgi:hypothetical protein